MIKIVYLSLYQGGNHNINGPLLKENVAAVMIRGGQGIWEDPAFRYNYSIAVDNDIPFGIWWFNQVNMKAQPQIDAFLKVWNSIPKRPIVVAYDVEEIAYRDANGKIAYLFPPSVDYSHINTLDWCMSIADETKAATGIYTRKNYFETWTKKIPEWQRFWLWIAAWYNYTGNVAPALPWDWKTYKIHQYEGGGLGTPGVDPNPTCKEYWNGSLESCLRFFGASYTPPETGELEHLQAQVAAWQSWYGTAPIGG